jgi:hypothetical protein
MIPTTPRSLFLAFCQSHSLTWAQQAENIGLSEPAAAAYAELVNSAVGAVQAAQSARDAAKAATAFANSQIALLRAATSSTVTQIRVFAEDSANPAAVYQLAEIPAPAKPTPQPAPGQPSNMGVSIDPTTGDITLTWKCVNPSGTSGTSYIVRRKLPGEAAFTFLGSTGPKRYTDTTLFAGPDSVQYTVQAQRSGLSGPVSAILTVNFGRLPGGAVTTTTTTTPATGEQAAAA